MKKEGINNRELAARIGKPKTFVFQILSGERNATLRTVADMLCVLGYRFELRVKPLTAPRTYEEVM